MPALGTRRWARQQPPVPHIDWSHPLAQGLAVCLWSPGAGKPIDLVSRKTATVTGPGQRPTEIGNAQKLDGSTSGFNVPVDLTNTNKVTVCTWLHPESEASATVIAELTANFNASEGFLLAWANSNASNWSVGKWLTASMHTNTGPSSTSFGLPDPASNRLHHIAARMDRSATSTQIYVDGVVQAMTASGTTANTAMTGNYPSDTLYVGARAGTSLFLNGRMPLLTVYKRILTDSEIQRLYVEPWTFFHAQSPRQRYWIASASTVTLSRSASDTASASDSVTVKVTLARAATDTAAASDAMTRMTASARALSDTAAASDAVARATAAARTASDAAGGTDSVTRATAVTRTAADSAPGADTASRTTGYSRSAADTASATDAVALSEAAVRTISDTAGGTDAVAARVALFVTVTSSAPASDAARVAVALTRALADTAGATDTVVILRALRAAVSDSAPASDHVVISYVPGTIGHPANMQTTATVRAHIVAKATSNARISSGATLAARMTGGETRP